MLNIISKIIAPVTVIPRCWSRSRWAHTINVPNSERPLIISKIISVKHHHPWRVIVTKRAPLHWNPIFHQYHQQCSGYFNFLIVIVLIEIPPVHNHHHRHKLSSLKSYLLSLFQAELVFPTRLHCKHLIVRIIVFTIIFIIFSIAIVILLSSLGFHPHNHDIMTVFMIGNELIIPGSHITSYQKNTWKS